MDTIGRMNYIRKHWRGELSLAVSFWVNYVAFELLWRIPCYFLTGRKPYLSPIQTARFSLILLALYLITYPWRVVGVCRACRRHWRNNPRRFWPITVSAVVVISVLLTIMIHILALPAYQAFFGRAFFKDPLAQYTLTMKENGTLIHLEGTLGYGISRDVQQLIGRYPGVRGIILDTPGGWAYEGRQLGWLVCRHHLSTYSIQGCYSAGITAFLAGRERYFARYADMYFHLPEMDIQYAGWILNSEQILRDDLKMFAPNGFQASFVERVFSEIKEKECWVPTEQDLLDGGVIHGVIDLEELLPGGWQDGEPQVAVGITPEYLEREAERKEQFKTLWEKEKQLKELEARVEELEAESTVLESTVERLELWIGAEGEGD